MKLANNSRLCIALDGHDYGGIREFHREIIGETHDLVGAYKINPAFFLSNGNQAHRYMKDTIEVAQSYGIPVIFDAKYGDVPHTNEKYAEYVWNDLMADAVTINPYVGMVALKPFVHPDKTVFILAATSNPGAEFIQTDESGLLNADVYMDVTRAVSQHRRSPFIPGEVGVVAPATYPDRLKRIANCDVNMPILIPGNGAQGGKFVDVPNGIYVYGRTILGEYDYENLSASPIREKTKELMGLVSA